MASKENVTALKTLVISMGFLLVGGTILLAVLVWKKVSAETRTMTSVHHCNGGTVDLSGKGQIIELSVNDTVVQAIARTNGGITNVYRINLCTGDTLTELTLKADPK